MKRTGNIWMMLGLFLTAFVIVTDRFIMPLSDTAAITIACIGIAVFGYGMWSERKKRNA